MIIISKPFASWTDAKHAANKAADEQGAAVIVEDAEFFRVISGNTIEECEAEVGHHRDILDSVVQGQRL